MLDNIQLLRRKKDKYIASMMDELEQVLEPDSKEFAFVRKIVLDHFNDYHRTVYKIILGIEVEGQHYL